MLPGFDPAAKALAKYRGRYLAQGLGASPGVASGQAVLDASRIEELFKKGPVILVQPDVTLADVVGNVNGIAGILTQKGGVTSHPMVVARAWGLACVTGCETLEIDEKNRRFRIGKRDLQEGDILSLDGSTGELFLGQILTADSDVTRNQDAASLLEWADSHKGIKVWANADYPWEIERARRLGAKGIGMCRTERMFLAPDRLDTTRQVILTMIEGQEDLEACGALLAKQRQDLTALFEAARGLPIVIRLLDAPLQDLLPDHPDLREMNPSLGLRGARLGVLLPMVIKMQVRAMFEAAGELGRRHETKVDLQIAIPMISYTKEFEYLRSIVMDEASAVMEETGLEMPYTCGVVIETPRAALIAGELARCADFITFDSSRLTEATLYCSRQDCEMTFIGKYLEKNIVLSNPFEKLDEDGVGKLIGLAVESGRRSRPDLAVGVCGFHGEIPESMRFYRKLRPAYVSCPRAMIPVARLASAQAKLRAMQPGGR
jgi:pyruvate,orthophosphate dikinase